jgi:hypothetical protein
VDGSIDTIHIDDDQVTYAKIQNVTATDRILGRDSAGAGVIEEITPANLRTMINVADGANAYAHPNHTGEVTSTADGATVIADDVVDEANLKISNAGSNGNFLSKQSGETGGLTWAAIPTLNQDTTGTAATVTTAAQPDITTMTGVFTGSANQLITDDGDGTVTSEANLTYDSETLTIGDDDNGVATIQRKAHSDEEGGDLWLRGGNGGGTDKGGGDVVVLGGSPTGDAAGGAIRFRTWAADGGSGSSLDSDTDGDGDYAWLFNYDGQTVIPGNLKLGDDCILENTGSMVFRIDYDNDETGQKFAWQNYTTEIAALDESGNLQIDGGLTTGSTLFVNSSGIIQVGNQTGITGTGALNSGSITSGFGNIDTGSSTIDTTGAVSTGVITPTAISHAISGNSAGDYGTGAEILYGISNETTTAGAIYVLRSGTWVLMDAGYANRCQQLAAVAVGTNSATNGMLIKGCVTLASNYTAGTDYEGIRVFASKTPGEATLTAPSTTGDIVRILGYSLDVSDQKMFFNPDNTYVEIA